MLVKRHLEKVFLEANDFFFVLLLRTELNQFRRLPEISCVKEV